MNRARVATRLAYESLECISRRYTRSGAMRHPFGIQRLVAERDDAGAGALRQLPGVHAEQAVRIARRGPHAWVAQQLLVEQDGEVVAERRHAADREAGGGAHLV